jgi:hypothetical protein
VAVWRGINGKRKRGWAIGAMGCRGEEWGAVERDTAEAGKKMLGYKQPRQEATQVVALEIPATPLENGRTDRPARTRTRTRNLCAEGAGLER